MFQWEDVVETTTAVATLYMLLPKLRSHPWWPGKFGNYDNNFRYGEVLWPVAGRYKPTNVLYPSGSRGEAKALAAARMHLEAGLTAAEAAAKSGGSATAN